ncbi:YceI family protein [Vannielia litorea]|uniref:YceI family protein n=1 Tax=Vannielia litorea TaxID=1217970 RepID=UPI001BCF7DDC|nr:YceI family protein [Vannielia litorea]MBS8227902.1 polyisoprenoid-binding protein [Vannielia litorea]
MKSHFLGAAIAVAATPVFAEAEKYTLDPSHSQIVFSYDHFGFSTTTSMFSGFEGEIMWDKEDPAASSVTVSFPEASLITGWDARTQHFMSGDFFGATDDDTVSFASTGIEVTGEDTALITGDLTVNGVTKEVVLDARLNGQTDSHPMEGKPWAGFSATTTLLRSDYNLGAFAPMVSDEVAVEISIEAGAAPAEGAEGETDS